jgi:hypothetical protein
VLQITAQMRILVAIEAVDGRKGIDSLVQLCREKLGSVLRKRHGTHKTSRDDLAWEIQEEVEVQVQS